MNDFYNHYKGVFLAWVLGSVSLLAHSNAFGQLKALTRYEAELKNLDNGFTLVPMNKNGIALIRENNKFKESKRVWEVTLLNTALEVQWQTEFKLKPEFTLIGYDSSAQTVYLLFREGNNDANQFELVQVNSQDKTVNNYEIKQQFDFRITHFSIVGENAVLGGYVSREPALLLYETAQRNVKVIPGFFLKDNELLDVRINVNQTFNTLLVERNSFDKKHLVSKTFDQSGLLLLEDYIEIDKDKTILTGQSSSLLREDLIIIGTYSEGASTEALGYYTALVDPYTEQAIQYFPFATLDHLLDYMPKKRAEKIMEKANERIAAGKNPDYKAAVEPFRIVEYAKGFFLLSEMYDPASTVNSRPYWNDPYNPYRGGYGYSRYGYNSYLNQYPYSSYPYNTVPQNSSVKMIQTMLTFFDGKGQLKYDYALKFENIKLPALQQTSDFNVQGNLLSLAYKKESNLYVITGLLGEEVEADTVQVPTKNPNDLVRYESEDDTGIRYWYGDYFFVWGYQSIRNKGKSEEDPLRHVFYISKFMAE